MTPAPALRRLHVEDVGDIAVVSFLDDRITEELNIQVVGDELNQVVDELGRRKVLLDFGNVEFMSSALLGKLPALQSKLVAVQGRVILCGLSERLMTPFRITTLDRKLTIVADRQAGLQAF